jgi:putative transposase
VPRKPRIEIPGGFFHITAHAVAGSLLYRDERDYEAWVWKLAATVERFRWRCHAYCALPGHFHLLLETPEPSRSAGMRHLNGSYAQRVNTRYDERGHVFEGPYRAKPIVQETHFLEVCRYVVLNPVRAGLCQKPGQWRWSSYRATAGIVAPPAFLTLETTLGAFADTVPLRRAAFRRFVEAGRLASLSHV